MMKLLTTKNLCLGGMYVGHGICTRFRFIVSRGYCIIFYWLFLVIHGCYSSACGGGTNAGMFSVGLPLPSKKGTDENTTCNDSEWIANHGGIWETGYTRVKYDFDEGMVSPLVNLSLS